MLNGKSPQIIEKVVEKVINIEKSVDEDMPMACTCQIKGEWNMHQGRQIP